LPIIATIADRTTSSKHRNTFSSSFLAPPSHASVKELNIITVYKRTTIYKIIKREVSSSLSSNHFRSVYLLLLLLLLLLLGNRSTFPRQSTSPSRFRPYYTLFSLYLPYPLLHRLPTIVILSYSTGRGFSVTCLVRPSSPAGR